MLSLQNCFAFFQITPL